MGKKNKTKSSSNAPDEVASPSVANVASPPVEELAIDIPSYQSSSSPVVEKAARSGHGHEHGHGHGHDDHDDHEEDHGHSHAHGSGHNHSHGSGKVTPIVVTSPKTMAFSHDDADINCSHVSQPSCAHDECLSEDELKAAGARRVLMWVSVFCFFFMCVELVGGYLSNSLAIMTDAAHLLSDLASFLISIVALVVARKAPTSSLSFGFHRAEILGAIVSVLLIWLLTGVLLYEAVERIRTPQDVDGKTMFIVATIGLAVNIIMGMILMSSGHGHSHGLGGGHAHDDHDEDDHGHSHEGYGSNDHHDEESHGHGHSHGASAANEKTSLLNHGHSHGQQEEDHGHSHGNHGHGHGHGNKQVSLGFGGWIDRLLAKASNNINVRAAFVHVIGDALQSFGVICAAALIWYEPSYAIADPICTFIFSVIVMFTTMRILREGVIVLMEGVPEGVHPPSIVASLMRIDGVVKVHDLHVWSLSVGNLALSAHIEIDEGHSTQDVLHAAHAVLKKEFKISHTTLQVETLHDSLECTTPVKRVCLKPSEN